MRKITETIGSAFKLGRKRAIGNTSTDGQSLHLHGNLIAFTDDKGYLHLSLAGWHTPTTRERLNGILQIFGINGGFYQRNYLQWFESKEPVSLSRYPYKEPLPATIYKEPLRLQSYDWLKIYTK